jgi:FkbM family methyltransferase
MDYALRMTPRRILELFSRGKTVWRSLPNRVGGERILLSPESALQYWRFDLDHPSCGRQLFDFATRHVRPGDVIWDIGANCGVFAFAAAAISGPSGFVLAVEPDRFLGGLMLRTKAAASPKIAKIDILPCAIADEQGIATLNVAQRGRSTNFLGTVSGRGDSGGIRHSERVLTVSLDWIGARLPPPNVLKIDVEGAEALAIRGARQMLSRAKPTVLCEVGPDTRQEVENTLRSFGYRILDADAPDGSDPASSALNLVAIHGSRCNRDA